MECELDEGAQSGLCVRERNGMREWIPTIPKSLYQAQNDGPMDYVSKQGLDKEVADLRQALAVETAARHAAEAALAAGGGDGEAASAARATALDSMERLVEQENQLEKPRELYQAQAC